MTPHQDRRLALPCIMLMAFAGLAGCADHRGYPSLAPRTVEQPGTSTDQPGPSALPEDPALNGRVAELVAQATAGESAFATTAAEACRAATRARGAAEGSEPWIALQELLSALDAARAPILTAAAELDQMMIARATATGAPVDTSRLMAALQQVDTIDTRQQAQIAALAAGRCPA